MRTKEKINPTFNNFMYISPKQVTLSIYMQRYRRKHNLSQTEMADLCTLFGAKQCRFHQADIWAYENYKRVPTPPKFQILMNTMDMDPSML